MFDACVNVFPIAIHVYTKHIEFIESHELSTLNLSINQLWLAPNRWVKKIFISVSMKLSLSSNKKN